MYLRINTGVREVPAPPTCLFLYFPLLVGDEVTSAFGDGPVGDRDWVEGPSTGILLKIMLPGCPFLPFMAF